MTIKLDKEYEVKCTLGTIRAIEKRFGKPFIPLMGELNKLTTTEQMRILYCGFGKANPDVTEECFCGLLEEHVGMGAFAEMLEEFVFQLQYPGKTREEIEAILRKKAAAAERPTRSIGAL